MPADTESAPRILRPTRAEIRLSAVRENLKKLGKAAAPARLLFVVKANAYGHGATWLARLAEREKLAWGFGVSSVEEGLALRASGLKSPVLVLGSLYPFESFVEAINSDLIVTIASLDAAGQVIEAARKLGKQAVCHIKLETGMGRIGARKPAVLKIYDELSASGAVSVAGMYTHLSSADTDAEYTAAQLSIFSETAAGLEARGARGLILHAANSCAAVNFPDSRMGMVRCGIAAYGLAEGFEPAMSIKTSVVFVKNVREGAYVSYNKSFRAGRPMKIATIPAGYGDGYLRRFSNKADVLIGGLRCRVLGNVTMDMTMVDVTAVKDAAVGAEAVLLGRQGSEEITAGELADIAETINYEIVTLVSARVPRVCIE
ncbi:MAG: alanine racemase [Elusimicrobia bacterium CG_4_10_14_0_2_um_filter_56_8]|nr:MAG: alanine racemase [Elusimicrobia bacterium CG1_02_56_21]PJA13599.1 MAG: alanine racemase [Elusimicrobia bacterium CG_4_10_14_0_2_um_filter_56_8]